MGDKNISYATLVLVVGILSLTMTSGIGFLLATPVATETSETLEKTETIYDADFTVDSDDFKRVHFTLDKGVDCDVSWTWDSSDDLLINFYLMGKDDYESWKESEEFEYVHKKKQADSDEGTATLGDGEYTFVFNNVIEGEEVEIEFKATLDWKETSTVVGSKIRYELAPPLVMSSLVTIVSLVTFSAVRYPSRLSSVIEGLATPFRRIVMILKEDY